MSNHRDILLATERAIAERAPGTVVAMLQIHVRRLRQVAVALGHDVAAAVPDAVLARLNEFLRSGDVATRVGEQDFLLMLPGLLSAGHAELAAQRVLREFVRPLTVLGRPLVVVVSVGLAWAPEHASDADQLWRRTLGALDMALGAGHRLSTATAPVDEPLLLDDLRDALINNELKVEFQSIIDLQRTGVVAVEALARWHCHRRGTISPERFVSLAEQGGLSGELTRWTLHSVLREFAQLARSHPHLRCHMNLTPGVFTDPGLVEQVGAALAIWGITPGQLVIEVTETAVMEDPEHSARALRSLRQSGIGIAIDDFGKGYSSFSYLKHIPATELKIDQGFVSGLEHDARAMQLLRSMIDLAHNLGLGATCEGVENPATADRLRSLGCDYAQGYHFGRPMPREQWTTAETAAIATPP